MPNAAVSSEPISAVLPDNSLLDLTRQRDRTPCRRVWQTRRRQRVLHVPQATSSTWRPLCWRTASKCRYIRHPSPSPASFASYFPTCGARAAFLLFPHASGRKTICCSWARRSRRRRTISWSGYARHQRPYGPRACADHPLCAQFFEFSKEVQSQLAKGGHWVDFIDPCSGLPVSCIAPVRASRAPLLTCVPTLRRRPSTTVTPPTSCIRRWTGLRRCCASPSPPPPGAESSTTRRGAVTCIRPPCLRTRPRRLSNRPSVPRATAEPAPRRDRASRRGPHPYWRANSATAPLRSPRAATASGAGNRAVASASSRPSTVAGRAPSTRAIPIARRQWHSIATWPGSRAGSS